MNDFIELRHFITLFWRRWPIILLAAILGAGLAFGISQELSPVYRATATLLVGQPIRASNLRSQELQTSQQLALTYAEIGRRQPVLQGTVDALDLDISWQQLKEQIRFRRVEGTQLLDVVVERGSPSEAQRIADEVARQLILLSPSGSQGEDGEGTGQFIEQRLDSLQERIESGQSRSAELERAITNADTTEEMRNLQDELDTLEGLVTEWESTYAQLRTLVEGEQATNKLEVMVPAQVDPNPVWPRVRLNTILGGVMGLLLVMGLIVWRDYWDETLQSADDLGQIVGLISLGAVSKIKGRKYQDKLINSLPPFAPTSEAYRIIRSNIRFASKDKRCKTILVTSATFGEGKSLTVANLGIAMARAGLETIIVDADLRRPAQHKIFDVGNEVGLTDLLRTEELEFDDRFYETGVELLHLLPSGTIPDNPSELLGFGYGELLLAGLAELVDVVIVDSPPVLSVADAALLSNQVDGVVVVIESGRTTRRVARQTISALQRAGADVLGAVINRASRRTGAGYYHYYPAASADPSQQTADARWWRPPFLKKASTDTAGRARTNTNGRYPVESMVDSEDTPSAR